MSDAGAGEERSAEIERYFARMASIDGWFSPLDARVMVAISRAQAQRDIQGDLLEIGVFKGKSASLLGLLAREGEQLHVCDPFERTASDEPDALTRPYRQASQATFEQTYREFRAELPVIHTGRSTQLRGALTPASFRLVHLDGSHAYADISRDLDLALELLAPGGVVCIDDYRTAHTPGVALATWEAVSEAALRPVCLTDSKLYATKPADPLIPDVQDALGVDAAFEVELHDLGELGSVIRVWSRDLSADAERPDRGSPPATSAARAWAKARAVADRARWQIGRRLKGRRLKAR